MVGKADQTVYLTLGLDVNERGQLAVTLQDFLHVFADHLADQVVLSGKGANHLCLEKLAGESPSDSSGKQGRILTDRFQQIHGNHLPLERLVKLLHHFM